MSHGVSSSMSTGSLHLQALAQTNADAMGFDVVDIERGMQGLVRIYIDRLDGEAVTIEDCEQFSRQLSHVFMVENIAYDRLEISSPGLDRPLKRIQDFVRFSGYEAAVKLRSAVAGQRSFEGVLVAPEGEQLGLEVTTPSGSSLLKFTLADIERARLVPKIDFKRKVR